MNSGSCVISVLNSIDPEISAFVELLNESGFPTIGSCQGGPSHQFARPTVQVRRPGEDFDETRKALCAFLLERGVEGFSVKTVAMHQRSVAPEAYSYVEVELWT